VDWNAHAYGKAGCRMDKMIEMGKKISWFEMFY
jgi:hypothetical protein